MTDTPSFDFRTGQEAIESAKSSGGVGFGDRLPYLSLPNSGDKAVIRFLTEFQDWTDSTGATHQGWVEIGQHNSVKTRPKPASQEKWPSSMSAVCRNDRAFNGFYSDCYICEFKKNNYKPDMPAKPAARMWAVACLRKEVVQNGVVMGYEDETRRVKKTIDGKEVEVEEKSLVWVNQAYKGFFNMVKGYGEQFGTVLDRDFVIQRDQTGKETSYLVMPHSPMQVLDPATGQPVVYDLRRPDFLALYEPLPSITDHLVEMSSDDFYARFFDERVPNPVDKKAAEGQQAQGQPQIVGAPVEEQQAAPQGDVTADQLAQMQARILGGNGQTPTPAAPSTPAGPAPAGVQPIQPIQPAPAGGAAPIG